MQYGVRSLIFKTLPVASSMALCCLVPLKSATAQVTPDGTLGAERSVVTPNVNINGLPSDRLDGGARRGVNLFHSFGDFNVGAGRGVYFSNPAGIENILTRVTGSNASNILGTLGVLGNANLFLLNPNGIIFGPNARLDLRGSFLATTASSLVFGNGLEFSATNPQAPPLLTVNIPIGLRFRYHPGSIVNQSVAPDSSGNAVGLQVQPGKGLALVAGDVTLDSGNLSAPGGRVELGGVSEAGTVGLNSDGSLSVPQGVPRADVSLTGGASVDVSAGGGGNIAVNARNLSLQGGSSFLAGIGQGLGSVDSVAGDVTLNATGDIKVAGSYIFNLVQSGGVGQGGNVNIITRSLFVTNGAQLAALTRGTGDTGSVRINARDTVTFDGVGSNGNSSGAYSFVETGAVGKGGDINITTGSLSVTNGAQLQTWTSGQGDAGSVNISASDTVTFDGVGSNGFSSGAFSSVETGAVGKGGDISITTGTLFVTNGARLAALTSGQGDAGSVNIYARDTVTFDGVGSNGFSNAAVSSVGTGAVGKGGDISITTGTLFVTNGAQLAALTSGQEDAGSVKINARETVTFDGVGSNGLFSGVTSVVNSEAVGKGGDIDITTGELFVTGVAQLGASTLGKGDAGSVNIRTGSLLVTGGGTIAAIGGQGNAGSININARDTVTFDGVNRLSSGAHNIVAIGAGGKAGDINIFARSLFLSNGSLLGTDVPGGQRDSGNILVSVTDSIAVNSGSSITTFNAGQGNGGNITLRAGEKVSVSGSRSDISTSQVGAIFGNVGNGKSGNINLQTRSLFLSDGASLDASALGGQANAGNIVVNATDSISLNSGAISTLNAGQGNGGNVTLLAGNQITLSGEGRDISSVNTVALGNGKSGNINLQTRSLSATNGSGLYSTTYGGDAGNITILASDTVSFDGVDSGANSVAAFGAAGNAGNIKLTARSLSLTNGAFLSSTSHAGGAAGSLEVTTAKDILLDNGAHIFSNTSGGQGSINLRSRDLFVRHNSDITTNATGTATGGNITINTGNLVAVPKENSDISANAEDSFGGRVTVTAAGIFGTKFRPQLTPLSDITATSKLGPQFSGTVQLNILSPDPSRGLAELPQNVVDPASQIAQNPCTKGKSSEFTIAGRGGLPPNPNEALNSDAVSVALVDATSSNQGRGRKDDPVPTPKTTIQKPIVPAQGWVFNNKGQVVLTAYNPAVTQPQRSWRNPGACHAL